MGAQQLPPQINEGDFHLLGSFTKMVELGLSYIGFKNAPRVCLFWGGILVLLAMQSANNASSPTDLRYTGRGAAAAGASAQGQACGQQPPAQQHGGHSHTAGGQGGVGWGGMRLSGENLNHRTEQETHNVLFLLPVGR